MSQKADRFAPKVRQQPAQMVTDHEHDSPSRWTAVVSISEQTSSDPRTLHEAVKKEQAKRDKQGAISVEVSDKIS